MKKYLYILLLFIFIPSFSLATVNKIETGYINSYSLGLNGITATSSSYYPLANEKTYAAICVLTPNNYFYNGLPCGDSFATYQEGADFGGPGVFTWTVSLPEKVKIWKFELAGRGASSEQSLAWVLQGSNDNVVFENLYSSASPTTTYIKEFLIDTDKSYKYYRFKSIASIGENPGLGFFQIYQVIGESDKVYTKISDPFFTGYKYNTGHLSTSLVYKNLISATSSSYYPLANQKTYAPLCVLVPESSFVYTGKTCGDSFATYREGGAVTAPGVFSWSINLLKSIKIWKFDIAGRGAYSEQAIDWVLEGGDGDTVFDNIYSSTGSTTPNVQTFEVSPLKSYSHYRFKALPSSAENPGLSNFQIYQTLDEIKPEEVIATTSCATSCFSNIMFFPGVMGSRLYDEDGVELWLSGSDDKQNKLSLNQNGKSINNISTKNDTERKEGEIDETGLLDDTYGFNIYESFINKLRDLKRDQTIKDYAFIPYDWRLSLDDIINNATTTESGYLKFTEAQEFKDSFILSKLRELQKTSKSGKVTIVAHSNGGLVTKALLQKLKEEKDPLYDQIDKVVLIAVPQLGTPSAVTGLLHGTGVGTWPVNLSNERSRGLSLNMPTIYNFLPTEGFFSKVSPIIEFAGNDIGIGTLDSYGDSIDTYKEFTDFLLNKEGRIIPSFSEITDPATINETFLNESKEAHKKLDDFTFSTSTKVYQISGFGLYTTTGLKYEKDRKCIFDTSVLTTINHTPVCLYYKNTFKVNTKETVNGDETVLVGSTQAMMAENYWVDLAGYNGAGFLGSQNKDRQHKDILEVSHILTFLTSLFQDEETLPQYISKSEPLSRESYFKYSLHSPLYLTAIDSVGNISGYSTTTGEYLEQIPGSSYLSVGETKILFIPKNTPHTIYLTSYAMGSFTLDIQEKLGDEIVGNTTFEAVPTATSTTATLIKDGGQNSLQIDFDGDKQIDKVLETQSNTSLLYELKSIVENNNSGNSISTASTTESNSTAITATSTESVNNNNQSSAATTTTTVTTTPKVESSTSSSTTTETIIKNLASTTPPTINTNNDNSVIGGAVHPYFRELYHLWNIKYMQDLFLKKIEEAEELQYQLGGSTFIKNGSIIKKIN